MFVAGIRETLVGKCQGTKNYQNNSGQRDWFHIFDFFDALSRKLSFGPE